VKVTRLILARSLRWEAAGAERIIDALMEAQGPGQKHLLVQKPAPHILDIYDDVSEEVLEQVIPNSVTYTIKRFEVPARAAS